MMDVNMIRRDDTQTVIFNPCSEKVEVEYRDDDNQLSELSIDALETKYFPAHKANVMVKHIIDKYVNQNKKGYITPEQREIVRKQIMI